jgi:hypothetical protein
MFKPWWGPRLRGRRKRRVMLPGEGGILIFFLWVSLAVAMVGGLVVRAFGG